MTTLLFTTTHGADDPERATVPFIAAATAAVSGQPAVVVCTADAAWLGVPGRAQEIEADGMPPLADLVTQFIESGGEIWLCSACATRRGITGEDVIDGATIVGAARIVETLAGDAKAISLT